VVTVAAGAAVSVLALLGSAAVDSGRLSGPWAAGLVLLPLALLEVLLAAPEAAATAARTAPARDRLTALAHTPPAVVSPSPPVPAPPTAGRLVAEHLGCGWEAPVVADVTLQVSSGGRIGVVGPSGSGKSTLAATLVRFIDPVAGSVQVDGTDLRSLALADVHRRVGLVDDDPFVFSSSVVENVRLADPSASRAQVESVLRTVSLGPWLDDLPDGLDTLVGEGRAAVSGGERARLGLARALLADQRVLVLDEPTAHLDSGTASEVAADLLAVTSDRAVVWISHDGVGMDRMDRIVDLADPPTTSDVRPVRSGTPL